MLYIYIVESKQWDFVNSSGILLGQLIDSLLEGATQVPFVKEIPKSGLITAPSCMAFWNLASYLSPMISGVLKTTNREASLLSEMSYIAEVKMNMIP